MANHKATLKSIRQTEKRTQLNRTKRSTLKTLSKKARSSAAEGKAEEVIPTYMAKLDKAVKTGLIHKNKANRLKSRIVKAQAKGKAAA